VVLLLILAIVGSIIFLANTPNPGERFTEFYILGPDGKAENYPGQVTLGESVSVIVGVVNHEQKSMSYRLMVNTDNVTNTDIPSITLDREAKWEQVVKFKPAKTGPNQKVEFLLYEPDSGIPYLTLHLWIDVIE
jgi:uncharacterized membrane protein